MSPGARLLLDLPAHACRWPSRHALDDPAFAWCGAAVESVGASYFPAHARRSISTNAAAPDDDLVIDDTGRAYRIVVARGRNLGDKRQFMAVVVGGSAPARRSPDSASDVERYPPN
jgi:hypothetical protein